jgi:MFS family permease
MENTQYATDALDEAHSSRIHKDITTIASLALFLAGIGYFILTLAIPLINHQWHLSQKMEGLLGSSALFGAIVGALMSGYLTDKLGRRTMLMISIIGVFLFSATSACTWNINSLILSRFLLGICISSNYPVAASYLAETMAVKKRGRKFCQAMLVNCIGAVAGVVTSYLILCIYKNVSAWRLMLALPCIPAVWAFIVSLRIPESPRWLMANNHHKQARDVINRMTQSDIHHEVDSEIDQPTYMDLFKPKFIKQTLLVCITWFLMDISYYGIGIFTPSLMQSLHFESKGDFFTQIMLISKETVFANIFIVIGAYLAVVLIERVGRIKLQAQGFLWVTIGLLLMCASRLFPNLPIIHLTCILGGFAIFNFFINMGPGATTYLIPAEVYPTNLRGKGHGFATACAKIGAAMGIFILPSLQNSVGALTTVLMIAGTTFLGYTMTVLLGFETKGKSLEQIHAALTKKKEDFIPEVKFDPYIGF